METTVYVDLFFMINFSMDFLCLYLSAKLLSHKIPLIRGLLAAAFGGIYANAALFFSVGKGAAFAFDVIACAIICAIAFLSKREWRRYPLYIIVYTAVSMALGGAMTALFNLFNRSGIFDGIRETDGDGISVWLFALLAIVSAAITLVGGRFFTKRMSIGEAELEITYGGRSVRLLGMTDSGNLLRDPISGKPCIVADISALSPILPAELREVARNIGSLDLDSIGAEHKRRLVLIPAATVSGGGVLLGVRVDRVSISVKGKKREADAIIALSDLSDGGSSSRALIPSCLTV